MGRRKEDTPKNIRRYTIQMDANLYRAVRMSALFMNVKTYELMNRIVLLGAAVWSKKAKDKNARIDVKGPAMTLARDLMRRITIKEK